MGGIIQLGQALPERMRPVEDLVIRFIDTFVSTLIMLNVLCIGTVFWDYMNIRHIIHLRMSSGFSSTVQLQTLDSAKT